jgi:hypothetical protein
VRVDQPPQPWGIISAASMPARHQPRRRPSPQSRHTIRPPNERKAAAEAATRQRALLVLLNITGRGRRAAASAREAVRAAARRAGADLAREQHQRRQHTRLDQHLQQHDLPHVHARMIDAAAG